MDDRYLFKAKRIDNGEWVQGVPFEVEGETVIIVKENENLSKTQYATVVDPSTIGQCTGLKDKNDNLIWENDIISFQIDNDDCPFPNKDTKKRVGKVFWQDFRADFAIGMGRHGSKSLNDDLWKYVRNGNRVEVMGNIFDNPELLESEE